MNIVLVLLVSFASRVMAGDFTDLRPDTSVDVGLYITDNVSPSDAYRNNIELAASMSGNDNYLVLGSGYGSATGFAVIYEYNDISGVYDTYVWAWLGSSRRGQSVDIAQTNNNVIIHQNGNTGFGVVVSGTSFSSGSQKSFAGENMACSTLYPCDNTAISADGSLWAHGWPSTLEGSAGASGQRGFIRLYGCSASSTCSPRQNAWSDRYTPTGYHGMRGRDDVSYHGHSVDIARDHTGTKWIFVGGAPGNTRQENGYEYPTRDLGGNNGDWRYGGYFSVNLYDAGLGVALQRIWAPNGDTTAAINNKFGAFVRLTPDGEYLVVSALGDGNGAFYVYRNQGDGVSGDDSFAYWKGPYYGPTADEDFGWSLAISSDGQRIFVGAPGANSDDGAVYVYNYATDLDEYVLQGNMLDISDGLAGRYGLSIYYDETRDKIYGGVPEDPDNGANADVGRFVVHSVPIAPTPAPTQSPTPPTMSPTAAPTTSPYIVVGTAQIVYNVKNGAARKNVAKQTLTDVKAKYSNPESLAIKVKSTETSTTSLQLYNQIGNATKFKESYAAARGCGNECTVTVDAGGRRMLQSGGSITVTIDFELSEEAYEELTNSGNDLDDPTFLDDLASELGVSSENITITVVGGEVTVAIELLATVTDEPSGEDTLSDLQEIQASLNNATAILVEELGGEEDSITTVDLDLCSSRDCSGNGDPTVDGTDENGCNIATGVCSCLNDRWGINCESTCECNNSGVCKNGLCHCLYPFYGLRCDNTVDCSC